MINQNSCIQNKLNSSSYEVLKELYLDLVDEKNELQKQIDINNDHMKEIDCYLKTILENDDVNIKVFSPRNTVSLYKDKIYDNQNNRTVFENENKYIYKRLNVVLNRIDKLKSVLDIIIEDKNDTTELQDKIHKTTDIDLCSNYSMGSIIESSNITSIQNDHDSGNQVNNPIVVETKNPIIVDTSNPIIVDTSNPIVVDTSNPIVVDTSNTIIGAIMPKNYPLDYKSIKINILDIQEKERQRIARDLHDSTVQNLTHLIHKIELASKFMDQDILRAKLELATLNKNVKEIICEIRNTIFNLRPMAFDDMSINVVLERFKDKLIEKSNMNITFSIDEITSLDNLLLVTIFRAIQECCWNSIQHSRGLTLSIDLKYNIDNVEIIIQDDGIGFEFCEQDSNNNHFGLSVLKERIFLLSGKVEISQRIPKGTSVFIKIPHTEGKIYD